MPQADRHSARTSICSPLHNSSVFDRYWATNGVRWYEGKILIFGNVRYRNVIEMVNKLKNCHGLFGRVIVESVHVSQLFPRAEYGRREFRVCVWKNR